jgi:RNA polymerase sigma-70 factor (ECF subfamily)
MNASTATPDPQRTSITLLGRLTGDGEARELAWNEFDQLYRPRIRSFARRMLATAGEADDLAQDVLAGFFRVNGGGGKPFVYDPKQSLRAYLFTATRNALITQRQRARHQPGTTTADDATRLLSDQLATEDVWRDIWEVEQINLAIERIRHHYQTGTQADPRTFEAFYRTFVEDEDTALVADDLGLQPATVRQARKRILARLQEEVAHLKRQEG